MILVVGVSVFIAGPKLKEGTHDIFVTLGLAKEKTQTGLESKEGLITILKVDPSSLDLNKVLFALDRNDWVASKEELKGTTLKLTFDEAIHVDSEACVDIWKDYTEWNSLSTWNTPSKESDWHYISKEAQRQMIVLGGKDLTISSLEPGRYYRIEFKPCFKSWDYSVINPAGALLKFEVE